MTLAAAGQPQNSALVVGGSDVGAGNPVPTSGVGLPASLGQHTKALSTSVTLASDQGDLLVAFDGTQDVVVDNFPLSQQAMATSLSVAIASDQTAMKVTEQSAPVYENNTDGVAMTQTRAIGSNTGAWTLSNSSSAGVGTSGILLKNAAGRVRSIRVSNANSSTGFWLQLHNKGTAPVNNDVPVDRIFVPSQTIAGQGSSATVFMDFGVDGVYLGTGVSLAASSTQGLLTLIAATDCHYSIRWI